MQALWRRSVPGWGIDLYSAVDGNFDVAGVLTSDKNGCLCESRDWHKGRRSGDLRKRIEETSANKIWGAQLQS